MEPVKFVALDRDDLEVVSAHLQDATVKVADVVWRPQEKRLVVGLNRFDWLAADGTRPELRRCRSALRFDRVTCCKCRNVDPAGKNAVLNLLAVEFSEDDCAGRCGDADLLRRRDVAPRSRVPGGRIGRSGTGLANRYTPGARRRSDRRSGLTTRPVRAIERGFRAHSPRRDNPYADPPRHPRC